MKIRHLTGIIALGCVLSMGAFGQTVSGVITGITVDPSDPAPPPRTGGITYVISNEGPFWNIAGVIFFTGIR